MSPEEWSALGRSSVQFAPPPSLEVVGYEATLRDGTKFYPFADQRVSVAFARDMVACADGRPDDVAGYGEHYWPVTITVEEASRQPWPCWYRTNVWRNGAWRPRVVLVEIDAIYAPLPVTKHTHDVKRGQCSDWCAESRKHAAPHNRPPDDKQFLANACQWCGAVVFDVCATCGTVGLALENEGGRR